MPTSPKRRARLLEIAFEAQAQKGDSAFWAFQDWVYAAVLAPGGCPRGVKAARERWESEARRLGLDMKKVQAAVEGTKHRNHGPNEFAEARKLGVMADPVYFINGRRVLVYGEYIVTGGKLYRTASPLDVFSEVVERELARAKGSSRSGTNPYSAAIQVRPTDGGDHFPSPSRGARAPAAETRTCDQVW